MKISGKIAIVTGASSGIGLATVRLLAKMSAKVVLAGRSGEKLRKISNEFADSFPVVVDMTDVKQIKKMVSKVSEHFGKIDILINNAGQGYDAAVERIDIGVFRRILDLDLVGPIAAMQEVIPLMRKQSQGCIVNISSGTALMTLPNMGAYSSVKRALAGISLTAREELEKDHISVSIVYPYITDTEFEKNTIKEKNLRWEFAGSEPPRPPDSADYAAGLIKKAIETGRAEIFAHDWMKK